MYIPFNQLSDNARIWIYQSDRKLTDNEIEFIMKEGTNFVESWTAHSQQLQASIKVFYEQFIVLSVDETTAAATGCSIDKSVHFVKQLEAKLDVQLLDKSKIAVKEGQEIRQFAMQAIKEHVKTGALNANSIIFNNMVSDISGFRNNWQVAAKDSWMNRYF